LCFGQNVARELRVERTSRKEHQRKSRHQKKKLSRRAECKSTKELHAAKPVEPRVPFKIQEVDSPEMSSQVTNIKGVTVQKT
jgi:hypothetical protein